MTSKGSCKTEKKLYAASLYDDFEDGGFDYGPAFRLVKRMVVISSPGARNGLKTDLRSAKAVLAIPQPAMVAMMRKSKRERGISKSTTTSEEGRWPPQLAAVLDAATHAGSLVHNSGFAGAPYKI